MITLLLLGIIYLTFISLGLPDAILGVAIPAIHLSWGTPISSFGTISMIVTGGTIVSSLTSGFIIGKIGTGKIAFISCVMTGGAILGMSFVPSFYWMIPLAFPLGLGAGAVDTALNNYVALHFKAHHMNWLHSFWGVGAMIGPLIMGNMMVHSTWQAGYRTIGGIQLGLSAILLLSLPLWRKHRPQSTIPDDLKERGETGTPLKSVRGIIPALAVMFLYCAGETGLGLWSSTFLTSSRGYSVERAAFWVSMYFGGITAGRLLSGFFSFRLNNTQMIRLGILLSLAGAILLSLPLPFYLSGPTLVLIGLGFAPIFPAMLHETPIRFGSGNSQKIIGLQMGAGYSGAAIMAPLLGLLLQFLGAFLLPLMLFLYILSQLIFSEYLNSMKHI